MKKYIKPQIKKEEFIVSDIITASVSVFDGIAGTSGGASGLTISIRAGL